MNLEETKIMAIFLRIKDINIKIKNMDIKIIKKYSKKYKWVEKEFQRAIKLRYSGEMERIMKDFDF
jgi:hypothetical protein